MGLSIRTPKQGLLMPKGIQAQSHSESPQELRTIGLFSLLAFKK